MKNSRHGFVIGIERAGNEFFLSLKVSGKLTHEDYQTINPLIDSALAGVKDPEINALVDAKELEGWELRAAWDDFKLGLKHGGKFKKIAVISSEKWMEYSTKVASWFTSGEVKYFDEADIAIDWLSA